MYMLLRAKISEVKTEIFSISYNKGEGIGRVAHTYRRTRGPEVSSLVGRVAGHNSWYKQARTPLSHEIFLPPQDLRVKST